jgi:hypothetical protein
MHALAVALRDSVGRLDEAKLYDIPTGSGETIVALRLAYPLQPFRARYQCGTGTEFHPLAPLNGIVQSLFPVVWGEE